MQVRTLFFGVCACVWCMHCRAQQQDLEEDCEERETTSTSAGVLKPGTLSYLDEGKPRPNELPPKQLLLPVQVSDRLSAACRGMCVRAGLLMLPASEFPRLLEGSYSGAGVSGDGVTCSDDDPLKALLDGPPSPVGSAPKSSESNVPMFGLMAKPRRVSMKAAAAQARSEGPEEDREDEEELFAPSFAFAAAVPAVQQRGFVVGGDSGAPPEEGGAEPAHRHRMLLPLGPRAPSMRNAIPPITHSLSQSAREALSGASSGALSPPQLGGGMAHQGAAGDDAVQGAAAAAGESGAAAAAGEAAAAVLPGPVGEGTESQVVEVDEFSAEPEPEHGHGSGPLLSPFRNQGASFSMDGSEQLPSPKKRSVTLNLKDRGGRDELRLVVSPDDPSELNPTTLAEQARAASLTPMKSALSKRSLGRETSTTSTRHARFAGGDDDSDGSDTDTFFQGGGRSDREDEGIASDGSAVSGRSLRSVKSSASRSTGYSCKTVGNASRTSRHSLSARLSKNERVISGRSALNGRRDIWLWLPLPLQLQLQGAMPSLQDKFNPLEHMDVNGEEFLESGIGRPWNATMLRLARGASREEVIEALAKRHELHVSAFIVMAVVVV